MNGDRYEPVIARSLSSSSELGALNHSATLASGNSFPITGVTSNDLNWSSTPFSSRGFGYWVLVGVSGLDDVCPLTAILSWVPGSAGRKGTSSEWGAMSVAHFKNYAARIFQSLVSQMVVAQLRKSIPFTNPSACRRGGRYTYSCNPPFELEIEENPLALVTYCIIPSNPSSSSSKSRGGDNKKLMINQNITDQRLMEMVLGSPSISIHLATLFASPARYQSRSCPQKEPLGPSSTVPDCVRSGMDEAILNVSERSLQTQNDFSIVHVQAPSLEKCAKQFLLTPSLLGVSYIKQDCPGKYEVRRRQLVCSFVLPQWKTRHKSI